MFIFIHSNLLVSDIISYLEQWAPLACQEGYDNAGLLTFSGQSEVKGILVCLDSTEAVVDEAIQKGCNLIIAHHPIIFKGLKSITGKNYVERTIIKAIQHNIAIYAIHTNLDNVHNGVNFKIAARLGLANLKILAPGNRQNSLRFTLPADHLEKVEEALKQATQSQPWDINLRYAASLNSDYVHLAVDCPDVANTMVQKVVSEVCPDFEHAVLSEVKNQSTRLGAGMVGELAEPMEMKAWFQHVKEKMQLSCIRYTEKASTTVKRVAVCGGSGSFLLKNAIREKADVYISSDFKYHEFFDADGRITIMDIGHYESEQFTIDLIVERLVEKFPTFAVQKTAVNTNPVKYFTH